MSVYSASTLKAGEPLMDGPRNPHDILAVLGEKELQKYLVDEIQEVYRLQGVNINDKHIETIVRRMLSNVIITKSGGTDLLVGEVVPRNKFNANNKHVIKKIVAKTEVVRTIKTFVCAPNTDSPKGISIMPGATALTVMPRLATSSASDLVAELRAPLAAE